MFNIGSQPSPSWKMQDTTEYVDRSRHKEVRQQEQSQKNGVFLKDPRKAAQALKRPSAPKKAKDVTWPESFSCYDFKSIMKSPKMQRSSSCGTNLGKL